MVITLCFTPYAEDKIAFSNLISFLSRNLMQKNRILIIRILATGNNKI